MRRRLATTLALASFAAAMAPTIASAAEPPNQNDPCSRDGRNVCGTLGVGTYEDYRYGLRWFGDYRGAIKGVNGPTFCLDLRFWYPGRDYDFAEEPIEGLRNREGGEISRRELARMAYAMWNFGRSNDPTRQAAVMLYVHQLMGDGAPGEVDPSAVGSAVESAYAEIERDAARYAGPYKINAELAGNLIVGEQTTLALEVRSASGARVPGTRINLSGADDLPKSVRTNADGVAEVTFTPRRKGEVEIKAASQVAAAAPKLYVPSKREPARNGQRLGVPAGETVSTAVRAEVAPAQVTVTTEVAKDVVLLGKASKDRVTISGVPSDWSDEVRVSIYGPARTRETLDCDGEPAATTSYTAKSGKTTTPPLTPPAVGYYTYQLTIPDTERIRGTTTPCGEPSETFKVETQPSVRTQVSAAAIDAGAAVTDLVVVSGLAGESATVNATLHGPFPNVEAIACNAAVWSGSFVATRDGTYTTDPVTLATPGYYTYFESLPAGEFTRAFETPCADAAETTIVRGNPQITTQVSAAETEPGAKITDTVVVTGLGVLSATVNVELWGPYPRRDAIDCAGEPYWTGTFPATGDGTYETEPVELEEAGYYTYRESIAATAAYPAVVTACGEATETTFAKAAPKVTTKVSNAVVRPGSSIFDQVKVSGLGETAAEVELEVYGPFRSRDAISCDGAPVWEGKVAVAGDGTYRSQAVKLESAGFYTYRERILASAEVKGTEGRCAATAETSLGRPLILTGRGEEHVEAVRVKKATPERPTSVRMDSVDINAPVEPAGIDMSSGALGVPGDIDRAGWWADGSTPGSRGATLLAGHVDSARRGAGAFYDLIDASRGDRVEVETADGKTHEYRVADVKEMRKERLPTNIYSTTGRERLVLVTCGGPFDDDEGRYRDNIVVVATPAG